MDMFIIIASDGVWDVLKDEDIINRYYSPENFNRFPGYCDRIFLHHNKQSEAKIVEYNSIPDIFISDHIPVYALIEI